MNRKIKIPKSFLLAAGFGALLLVLGGSAAAVWRIAHGAQDDLTMLHAAHMRSGSALDSILADVYRTGILTRDYLLDEGVSPARYRHAFDNIRATTARNFAILDQTIRDAEQRASAERLRRAIESRYWEPAIAVLRWTEEEKEANREPLLSDLVKQRENLLSLAAATERLMEEDFSREQERATFAQRFRSSFGWTIVMAMLLGLAISGAAMIRLLHLENQSDRAENELRRLSGQIRKAREQERQAISRALHDESGQLLTGLRMELGSLARIEQHNAAFLSRLEHSKRTVEQLIRSIRNTALLLRPSMLDDLGLTAALDWLAREASRTSGIAVFTEVDPAADALPEAHRTCLYRVIQEALTNAARHSAARRVDIALRMAGGWVTAGIADDGRGFDPAADSPRGLGLTGMEERVKELGGAIQVITLPGRGTRVEIRLLRPAEGEEVRAESADRRRSRNHSDRIEASA